MRQLLDAPHDVPVLHRWAAAQGELPNACTAATAISGQQVWGTAKPKNLVGPLCLQNRCIQLHKLFW